MRRPRRPRRGWLLLMLAGVGGTAGAAVAGVLAADTAAAGVVGVATAVVSAVAGLALDRAWEKRETLQVQKSEAESTEENKRAELLGTRELPASDESLTGLLRPERGVVPFLGRRRELDGLRAWREADGGCPVRLLTGSGGVGKTRLALEFSEDSRAASWKTVLVASGRERAALAATVDVGEPTLLVVDYAETLAELESLLADMAALIADDAAGEVRVLLVARQAGEWWNLLGKKSSVAVRDLVAATTVMDLAPELDPNQDPVQVAADAVPRFARLLQIDPPQVSFTVIEGSSPEVLVLHAAALVAVLDSRASITKAPGVRAVIDLGVLSSLLAHEGKLWAASAERAKLELALTTIEHLVAVVALLGGPDEEVVSQTLRRVPDLADANLERLGRVGRWLRELYPGRAGMWLEPVRPDLLAEHHCATQLADSALLRRACSTDLEPRQAANALTVLARATTHHDQAEEIISEMLAADLDNLALPAIAVALQTGIIVGDLLATALDHAPSSLDKLQEIDAAIPYPTVALAAADAVVSRRIYKMLPGDAPPEDRARRQGNLAVSLAQLGDREQALEAADEATGIYRVLAEARPDAFLPDLAGSL
ncbi:hypothetical protein, partial [Herbidospora cretacea]|uniref:hypothetical protein n=1 Tax=Herbidospora cretacea TaxID=28444 RepID=UPI000A8FD023